MRTDYRMLKIKNRFLCIENNNVNLKVLRSMRDLKVCPYF